MSAGFRSWTGSVAIATLALATLTGGASRNFAPDATFTGSSLTGWHVLPVTPNGAPKTARLSERLDPVDG